MKIARVSGTVSAYPRGYQESSPNKGASTHKEIDMCSRVVCNTCKKYTWSGCGGHIDDALAGLTEDQICKC